MGIQYPRLEEDGHSVSTVPGPLKTKQRPCTSVFTRTWLQTANTTDVYVAAVKKVFMNTFCSLTLSLARIECMLAVLYTL